MSLFIAFGFGLMGIGFSRLGALRKLTAGGGSPPVSGTPTYHIYFF